MRERLSGEGGDNARVFEIRYRHAITADDEFEMLRGFNNFDKVREGQMLGTDRPGRVKAGESGIILMPLYQKLARTVFLSAARSRRFGLRFLRYLRRLGIQNYVHLLPGVRRHDRRPGKTDHQHTGCAYLSITGISLTGFRRRRWIGTRLVVSRRKHDTDAPFKWKGE